MISWPKPINPLPKPIEPQRTKRKNRMPWTHGLLTLCALSPGNPVCIKTGFSHEVAFPYSFRESKVIQRVLEMVSEIDLMRADSVRSKNTPHLHNKRKKFFQSNMLKHRI